MRKVVGSTQGQIRTQIFTETILVNIVAGVLAVGLVAGLRAVFVQVAGLPDGFTIFNDVFFWESLGAFLVLSIVLSGFYPAFVLSSFDPVTVLKGNFSRSAKGILLRKSLVVFQFTITLILLVQTFAVYRQVNFLREQNLGRKYGPYAGGESPGGPKRPAGLRCVPANAARPSAGKSGIALRYRTGPGVRADGYHNGRQSVGCD